MTVELGGAPAVLRQGISHLNSKIVGNACAHALQP
jgi:hypothetical protein